MAHSYHRTLIITGYKEVLEKMYKKAFALAPDETTPIVGGFNGVYTFAILPTGEPAGYDGDHVSNIEQLCQDMDEMRMDDVDYPSYTLVNHGGDNYGVTGTTSKIEKGEGSVERFDMNVHPDDKLIAMDCETGGLGDDVSLLTVWFGIYSPEFQLMDELSLKIKPEDGLYHIQAQALEVNGINLIEHDKVAETKRTAGKKLYEFLKKNKGDNMLTPVGHNVAGDVKWVQNNLLNAEAWNQFCSYRKLDSSTIARFLKMCGVLNIEKAGLSNLIEYFELDDKIDGIAHEERYDAIASLMAIEEMVKLVRRMV